ncbi:MAG: MATE family efflux transporter [Myxococcota bacterium]
MSPLTFEIRALLRIGAPMMIVQGGLVLMSVVDTLVVGRVSPLAVASVGLGSNTANLIMALVVGTAMGLEPLASQAMGRGDEARALFWLQRSVWLALVGGVALSVASLALPLAFRLFDISGDLAETSTAYIWARAPGQAFCFLFSVYRSFLSALGRTSALIWAIVWANLANLLLDGILVLGLDLGATGVGLATSACFGVLWLSTMRSVRRRHGVAFDWRLASSPEQAPTFDELRVLLRLGLPIGLQFLLEVGIFSWASAAMASFGETWLAGHQIALTMASFTFMSATGLAMATTSRVGQHVGAGRGQEAKRVGRLGITLGGGFMVVGGLSFLFFRRPIAFAFAPDAPAVVSTGAALLTLAALFSLSDGIQAVAAGALRGIGDTRAIFWANMVGHWCLGLPVAWWAAHGLGHGPPGLWWGLIAGLSFTAVFLLIRFERLARRPLQALEA